MSGTPATRVQSVRGPARRCLASKYTVVSTLDVFLIVIAKTPLLPAITSGGSGVTVIDRRFIAARIASSGTCFTMHDGSVSTLSSGPFREQPGLFSTGGGGGGGVPAST